MELDSSLYSELGKKKSGEKRNAIRNLKKEKEYLVFVDRALVDEILTNSVFNLT